jgi:hypothetical protein
MPEELKTVDNSVLFCSIIRDVQTQGPLGEAHRQGETLLRESLPKGTLISLRPTAFHSNFERVDLPSILKCSSFASPLGMYLPMRMSISSASAQF